MEEEVKRFLFPRHKYGVVLNELMFLAVDYF